MQEKKPQHFTANIFIMTVIEWNLLNAVFELQYVDVFQLTQKKHYLQEHKFLPSSLQEQLSTPNHLWPIVKSHNGIFVYFLFHLYVTPDGLKTWSFPITAWTEIKLWIPHRRNT